MATVLEERPAVELPRRRGVTQRGRVRQMRRPNRLVYLTLIAFIFFSAFALYWGAVVASRTSTALSQFPPPLSPGANLFSNIGKAFQRVEFSKALVNSFIVAGSVTLSVVFFSTLAGFAFAKLRFRGRNALMLTVIATMMVPTQLGIIPLYIMMINLHWTNHLQAVIAPGMVTAFGVFFMRQFLVEAVPTELLEAGRMDGCSMIRLVWHVVFPAARPGAAVLGMLTFLMTWNDFLWPLVVLSPQNPTVQVAMSTLSAGSGYTVDYSVVMAGTVVGVLPLLLVFVVLGKHIISGIMQGAVKG